MHYNDNDIAIVGLSVFCPAGESIDEFWQGISQGVDFITEVPHDVIEPEYFDGIGEDVDRFYCNRGGFSKVFKVDPLRYGILPIAASGVEPDQLMSLAGVDMALHDAGVFEKGIPLQKCSIIIGKGSFSGLVALRCSEIIRVANQITEVLKIALPQLTEADLYKVKKAYQLRQGRFQGDTVIGTMPNLIASLVANRFDMHGPAYTVDAACASGIVALNQSMTLLRTGQVDIAVAGGMHSAQSAMFWSAFDIMGAMSHRGQIAPFSADADGLLIGQGGGFIVLKTLKKAQEDEDRIYAVIKETAVCSDGSGTHVTVTSVKGQTRVLGLAWERSGMDREELGLIEAHGTATPVGDRTEIATLKEFFGDNTHPRAYVGSIKSNIGHTMPSAGTIGVIKTALALYHRTIPPTLHCETPMPAMYESRFMPPQEPMPWDGTQIPLVAGVNAFGFGGINSHAILTAYEPPVGAPALPRHKPYLGETLMVSATDKDALIAKLQKGDYTNTGGTYRLIIFNPDAKRIEQAISVVEKDVPWKGRLDIWFSNRPLLSAGGKAVYMFPGYYPDQTCEMDTLSDTCGLPRMEELLNEVPDGNNVTRRHHSEVYYRVWLAKTGLEKLGFDADIYIGHSIGEWNATTFGGMTDDDNELSSQATEDVEITEKYPLISVSGVSRETVNEWCERIPGLYLTNDNCPNQILLTGEKPARDALQELLEREQIYSTVLPSLGGIHTPLFSDMLRPSRAFLEKVHVHEGRVPVFSGTTLEPVPTNHEEYVSLVDSQLTRPVYFRELIEKLYDEQDARVFIQLSLGSLVGFVEDTLKGRDFGAVASTVASRNGADQLRRVMALLFIEGREVDPNFMGVKALYQVEHSLMILPMGAPLFVGLPELEDAMTERYGSSGPGAFAFSPPAQDGSTNPLLSAASANMHAAMQSQDELLRLFEGVPSQRAAAPAPTSRVVPATPQAPLPPTAPAAAATPADFEEPLRLTYEEYPYLVDHSIVRQPADWPYQDDLNPVVPLTMTIELLAEIALKHALGRKLVKISKMTAYQWVGVERPFEGTVKGSWKAPDLLLLELEGRAKAEFNFADEWPVPPTDYAGDINIGAEIMECPTAAELYDGYAFHGPRYHSSTKMLSVCERGITNLTEKQEGKGSLLDIMGQQLGVFLHLTQTENTISFPVRLKELAFYDDLFDQDGTFEHTLIVTRMTDDSISGDMVLKRNGKVWSVARDFICQRFLNDRPVWYVMLKPQYNKLAQEIAPGVFLYSNRSRSNVLTLLEKRYLNSMERGDYLALESTNLRREYITARIALKDAVRSYVARDGSDMLFPIELLSSHDSSGRPTVCGYGPRANRVGQLHVSLAHKGDEAVAMVSTQPVGVDIEKIEDKTAGFFETAFTEGERALMEALVQPEAAIRFWVAKEAVAKQAGTGLLGNPKNFEVCAVDGTVLTVGKVRVQTMDIGKEHIAGWTI
ncbi:MAG: 4'-phosphopantetheinyl transferase superfamily protein [Coriobacteriales bacterium]|jgi:3-oxoacyl-(acyl-carrier-protein) synthase/malonyl CoA-acyl carrier protein transacylase/phosphopantetheinyl transferase (holo-ACP synthase)|nr:4'-phosphopantetheinyl transferase superfamily protein [Coriobacteriales bacterium]